MKIEKFIIVGENIHCTRILKVGGKSVAQAADGKWAINYKSSGKPRSFAISFPIWDYPHSMNGRCNSNRVA